MKQCNNGHIYDETRYGDCPYCKNDGSIGSRPLSGAGGGAFPKTMPLQQPDASAKQDNDRSSAVSELDVTVAKPVTAPHEPRAVKGEMGVTVALNLTDSGINPVRGWLVVIEGEKKGTAFTIHSEKNSVGRGSMYDVNLSFDRSSSKDGDAVITFDARKCDFYISPASGRNNVYLNDNILLQPEKLEDYDILEIGATKFVFRSLCNEQFTY